jgi:Co/Zn/Cd efflux system component
MGCHCHQTEVPFDGIDPQYKRILWIVIVINAVLFVIEMVAGTLANSMALQADALDFLGDTITYGLSLAVIGHSLKRRHAVALFKAITLVTFGLWVLGTTIYHVFVLNMPVATIMTGVAILAFAANLVSVLLLYRFKDGDANVRSVWLCSRNDMIGNIAVIGAASMVSFTQSGWPDLIVAFLMSSLFCHSAYLILKQVLEEKENLKK